MDLAGTVGWGWLEGSAGCHVVNLGVDVGIGLVIR
jgi:hypothetical protein